MVGLNARITLAGLLLLATAGQAQTKKFAWAHDPNTWYIATEVDKFGSKLPFHQASFIVGFTRGDKCVFSDELDVDMTVVETRSCDLKHVHYAPGWNRQRVDKVLAFLIDERTLERWAGRP